MSRSPKPPPDLALSPRRRGPACRCRWLLGFCASHDAPLLPRRLHGSVEPLARLLRGLCGTAGKTAKRPKARVCLGWNRRRAHMDPQARQIEERYHAYSSDDSGAGGRAPGRQRGRQACRLAYPATFPGENAAPATIAAWRRHAPWSAGCRASCRCWRRARPVSAICPSIAPDAPATSMLSGSGATGRTPAFQGDPPLQLEWLLNQLIAIRDRAVFLGARHFGERPSQWGEWITLALVAGRPPAYEARLQEARSLIDTGCATPPPCLLPRATRAMRSTGRHRQLDGQPRAGGRAAARAPDHGGARGLRPADLNYGDADAVGYFEMRESIWNRGPYAGFPENPELQIKWFIDQASAVRAARIAAGDADFGKDAAHSRGVDRGRGAARGTVPPAAISSASPEARQLVEPRLRKRRS